MACTGLDNRGQSLIVLVFLFIPFFLIVLLQSCSESSQDVRRAVVLKLFVYFLFSFYFKGPHSSESFEMDPFVRCQSSRPPVRVHLEP